MVQDSAASFNTCITKTVISYFLFLAHHKLFICDGLIISLPTTPFYRFRLFPVRSPLLRESLLLSFPPVTKMFQFTGLSLTYL